MDSPNSATEFSHNYFQMTEIIWYFVYSFMNIINHEFLEYLFAVDARVAQDFPSSQQTELSRNHLFTEPQKE